MSLEFLWYIPNQVIPGHRGEPVTDGHNSLDTLTAQGPDGGGPRHRRPGSGLR